MSNNTYREVDGVINLTNVDPEYVDKVNEMINSVLDKKNLTAKIIDNNTEDRASEDDIDYNICNVCGKNEECGYIYCGIRCCSNRCYNLAVKDSVICQRDKCKFHN